MMEDAIEHGCREDEVAGEGLISAAKRQVGRED